MYLTLRDRPGARDPGESLRTGSGGRPVARVVFVLGAVSLLTDIASESVTAVLPLYLTAVVGLTPAAYGVVDGLYQGVSALVRVAAGWSADRTGAPKWVAFVGYGLSAAARVALVFAAGMGAITALLATDRIGKGLRTAPRDAMIASSSTPASLATSFGVHRAMDGAGAALGPLLAFAILWWVPDGFTTVLVCSAGFAVVGVAVLGLFVPAETGRVVHGPERTVDRPRLRDVLTPRSGRLFVVAGGLGLLTVGDGFVYLTLLDSGGFAATWFPLLYVGTNVAFLLLAVPLGRVADRWGPARMLVIGHLALAGAYVAAAAGLGVRGTLVTLLLLGAFYAATDGTLSAVAGRLVPERARATGIGAAQTVVALARMLAAAGFGLVWVLVGPAAGLLALAVALAVLVPVAMLLLRDAHPDPADADPVEVAS